MTDTTKPPIGLIPYTIAINNRIKDICEAVIRYQQHGAVIPDIWLKEICLLNELERKLRAKDT